MYPNELSCVEIDNTHTHTSNTYQLHQFCVMRILTQIWHYYNIPSGFR